MAARPRTIGALFTLCILYLTRVFKHPKSWLHLIFYGQKCGQILSIGFIYACHVSCQRCIGTLFLLSLLFLHLLLILMTFMLIIVGPLPPSNDSHICWPISTCRFTHWPEAIPMADMIATTIVQALLSGWISCYGVPSTITTDRGAQFGSALWTELMKYLGTTHLRTTSYHPQSNGLIERFRCQLKAALWAQSTPDSWTESLPLVLLGICTAVKKDLQFSTAELVYVTTLCLPGDFISSSPCSDYFTMSLTIPPDFGALWWI